MNSPDRIDGSHLQAIQEALRSSGAVESSLMVDGCETSLSAAAALRIFLLLMRLEWRRGKGALFHGIPLSELIDAWKRVVAERLGLP